MLSGRTEVKNHVIILLGMTFIWTIRKKNHFVIFLYIHVESEWKLLLNYITETVVHCPAAFISIPQPSNNVPNQDHGEPCIWTLLRQFSWGACATHSNVI